MKPPAPKINVSINNKLVGRGNKPFLTSIVLITILLVLMYYWRRSESCGCSYINSNPNVLILADRKVQW